MNGYSWFQGLDPKTNSNAWYLYKGIRCGKKNCHKCPHGPYLYQRKLVKTGKRKRTRELYIGKIGSEAEQAVLTATLAHEAHLEATCPF